MDGVNEGQIFHEVQSSKPWWVWAIVLVIALLGLWAFVQQILLGQPYGNKPAPDWTVWVLFLVASIGIPFFLLWVRLTVEVDEFELRWSLRPFWSSRIPLDEIRQAKPRVYEPMREYLGWGIRVTPWSGWAISLSGNRGVQLELASGRRVLIGSNLPEELADAIRSRVTLGSDGSP